MSSTEDNGSPGESREKSRLEKLLHWLTPENGLYISSGARLGLHRLVYALVILFALDFLLTAAIVVFLSRQISDVHKAANGGCAFFSDIATLPLPASPKPSRALILIITDSRTAYARQCNPPGEPLPASPALTRWQRYYHIHPG